MGYSHSQTLADYPYYRFYFTTVTGFAWAVIFFNAIVVVLFYAFKKNRAFPASIQAWTLSMDILCFGRELFKWGPYSIINEKFALKPTIYACRILFGWEAFAETGQALCNVYLAFSIYNSIVRKKDMSYTVNPIYFKVMVGIFWVYVPIWVLVQALAPHFVPAPYSCRPSVDNYNIAFLAQWGVALIIEAYLLGNCLFYVRDVFKAAKSNTSRESYYAWLNIRFLCIIFLQWIPRIAWNMVYILPIVGYKNYVVIEKYTIFMYANEFSFYVIDGLIVLIANRELRKFVLKRFNIIVKSLEKSKGSGSTDSPQNSLSARSDHSVYSNRSSVKVDYNNLKGENVMLDMSGDI